MFVIRIVAALTVAWVGSGATQPPSGKDPVLDQENVAIVRTVVETMIVPEVRAVTIGRAPVALLIDHTLKLSASMEPRGLPRQRTTETSFQIPDLNLPSIQLVAPEVVQRAFERGRGAEPVDGWEELSRLFPGFKGFAQVTAPGFVDDGAVVLVSFACGSLCGKSWLVRLTLRDGRWRVVDQKLLSVS